MVFLWIFYEFYGFSYKFSVGFDCFQFRGFHLRFFFSIKSEDVSKPGFQGLSQGVIA